MVIENKGPSYWFQVISLRTGSETSSSPATRVSSSVDFCDVDVVCSVVGAVVCDDDGGAPCDPAGCCPSTVNGMQRSAVASRKSVGRVAMLRPSGLRTQNSKLTTDNSQLHGSQYVLNIV